MNARTLLVLAAVLALIAPARAGAARREVCPYGCPYGTIQAGIDAAAAGDLVLVHDGVYAERINFKNRAVTVRSVNGPDSTVIDAGGWGRAVTFDSFEGPDSVLEGFTVTGGADPSGAGIYINQASPTVRGCVVTGNRATYGGGIYVSGGAPLIAATTLLGNEGTDRGGGIYAQAIPAGQTLVVEDCTISGNTGASGFYLLNSPGKTVLRRCRVLGNEGGIFFNSSELAVERTLVLGNANGGIAGAYGLLTLADSRVAASGGTGVRLSNFTPGPPHRIVRSTISGNASATTGGGIYLFQTDLEIEASVVSGNTAEEGGGIYNNQSSLLLDGVTVARNSALFGGGLNAYDATVVNSVFWGNTGTVGPQFYNTGGAFTVSFSDVQGGWGGAGGDNINADPLFADDLIVAPSTAGDFHLLAGSPCTDAGTDTGGVSLDLDGDPAPRGAGRDLGADEFARLGNGSFEAAAERVPAPWRGRRLGRRDGRATGVSRSGEASFVLGAGAGTRSLGQTVAVAGSAGDALTLELWSRARRVASAGGAYGAALKVFHGDGTTRTWRVGFSPGTHAWQRRARTFTAAKDYTKVLVTLLFGRARGRAWFDDVSLAIE